LPARYLQETGSFTAAEALIKAALLNCVDKDSLAYAWLADTAGTIHERQGHAYLALRFVQDALKIHLAKSPAGSVDLANAYSAVGVQYTALWQPLKGIENQVKAIANSPAEHDEKLKFNPDRYLRNRARSYFVAGNYEASKTDLKEAEYWQSLIHGEDSHYHGEYVTMLMNASRIPANLPSQICIHVRKNSCMREQAR
jgi:tetratricopeptide (TPR) repeat protein